MDTASWLRQKRRASSASVFASASRSFLSASARSHTCRRRAPLKYWLRKSPEGNFVSGVIEPVRPPSSKGTRATTPTSCRRQAGKKAAAGLWSNTL